MRTIHGLASAIAVLLLAACAGIASAPTPEQRQALAPTGPLRVGLQLGSPHNVVRDSVTGESVAFVGFSPARAKEWDFTALHMQMEFGYLIPKGSSIATLDDVDQAGMRVAVQEKSQPDVFISRTLKKATVVRGSTLSSTVDMLASGKADAIFSIKPSLYEASNGLPGSRVLDGRVGTDLIFASDGRSA